MSRNSIKKVVILGAGFSAGAGIPQQRNILENVFNIDTNKLSFNEIQLANDIKIIKYFLSVLYNSSDNYNDIPLEDIYTIIDTAIVRQRNIGIFNTSALFLIRESLDRSISFVINEKISDSDLQIYAKKISEIINSKHTVFVSLNWDFLIERILLRLDYRINYDIPIKYIKPITNKKKISVYKPHGSINWKICPICETLYSLPNYSISFNCNKCIALFDKSVDQINALENLRIPFLKNPNPVIISPTFLKNNYIPQLNMIFTNIYENLVAAKEIILIGYSLPISDHDIRNILIKAYSINENAKIKVILKEDDYTKKERLSYNYCTIYQNNANIIFDWSGF